LNDIGQARELAQPSAAGVKGSHSNEKGARDFTHFLPVAEPFISVIEAAVSRRLPRFRRKCRDRAMFCHLGPISSGFTDS
jgi:hypothetical protein